MAAVVVVCIMAAVVLYNTKNLVLGIIHRLFIPEI